MNRRGFLGRMFWGLAGTGLFSGLYTWQIEPFWLEFVKVRMPIRNLPKNLIGKTLMQISDMHVGTAFDHQFIIQSLEKAKGFKPDFVVYTGDFVSTNHDNIEQEKLEETLRHVVRGKLATLGVLGNHDYGSYWSNESVADIIAEQLSINGIRVLRNQAVEVEGLNFIGFDDFWGTNFNPAKAMDGFDSSKANIALCHNPDVCDLDIWKGYDSWILSGHTHGGQVKPPFLPPPLIPVSNKRYTAGQFQLENGRTLYINRALGHLYQVRLNVRPEITIFELQQS